VGTVTGLISFFAPVYSPRSSLVSVLLSRSSPIHWWTAETLVHRMRVWVLALAITAMPTMVLPAPHGSTTMP
jgi:hypothetical protein